MVNVSDVVYRTSPPTLWSTERKIPWHDPDFSRRMLLQHLSQAHDAASRRFAVIDSQVSWIHKYLLSSQPSRILDLGCGPGLYMRRFMDLGHTCMGIDFSPASIAYARSHGCNCQEGDLIPVDYGSGYDLVMLIYGEFNVFHPDDARHILEKSHAALKPRGKLLLEVHPFDVVKGQGQTAPSWYTSDGGLFSDDPHIVLNESFWFEAEAVAVNRHFVLDGQTVATYGEHIKAYLHEDYQRVLAACGFGEVKMYPSMGEDAEQPDLFVIEAQRLYSR